MKHPKLYPISAITIILLSFAVAIAFLLSQNPLFNGKVTVQAFTDKTSYLQGENITIIAYLTNGKWEAIDLPVYPARKGFTVDDSNGTGIYSWETVGEAPIPWNSPAPTLAPHSEILFALASDNATFIWNQTAFHGAYSTSSGNYTITVTLGEWKSDPCMIEIKKNGLGE